MRVGMNPQKQGKRIELKSNHRIVIVAYIPSLEGYYANVFEVFKLCVASANATKNSACELTLVNNGSCKEVTDYINTLYESNEVNCVIHHKENIGKMDAMIGAARMAREAFVTLSDIDILFTTGWQEEVEALFHTIPNVGSVSPISVRAAHSYATFSSLSKIILKKVKFNYEVIKENFESHNRFLESINWEKEEDENLKWPVVSYGNKKAILGSSHQILTIKRELLFSYVPIEPSLTLVGNLSEYRYIDLPIDLSNKMRLATYTNFAYHMGNTVEDWMLKVQKENMVTNTNTESIDRHYSGTEIKNYETVYYKIKKRIVKKIFKLFYSNK
ncbi:glycosyltransferase [Flavobacterium sp.]|uniref:glycosyltransferase n=1 Tax=Flavobacterium sp. TaxID=239 RepID=UPI00260F3E28|nr:glycosyltransferase [Flavobacterium sp.]